MIVQVVLLTFVYKYGQLLHQILYRICFEMRRGRVEIMKNKFPKIFDVMSKKYFVKQLRRLLFLLMCIFPPATLERESGG